MAAYVDITPGILDARFDQQGCEPSSFRISRKLHELAKVASRKPRCRRLDSCPTLSYLDVHSLQGGSSEDVGSPAEDLDAWPRIGPRGGLPEHSTSCRGSCDFGRTSERNQLRVYSRHNLSRTSVTNDFGALFHMSAYLLQIAHYRPVAVNDFGPTCRESTAPVWLSMYLKTCAILSVLNHPVNFF